MEENIKDMVNNNEVLSKNSGINNGNPPPPQHMLKTINSSPSTYIEVITEKDEDGQPVSVLEVDLVISREKGKETRRLSMNFTGIDFEKKEMIEKSVNLDRESFEILKKFFTQLDWNS
jgi:hypothetical protein